MEIPENSWDLILCAVKAHSFNSRNDNKNKLQVFQNHKLKITNLNKFPNVYLEVIIKEKLIILLGTLSIMKCDSKKSLKIHHQLLMKKAVI